MYWLSLQYAVCQSACFQTSAPTLFPMAAVTHDHELGGKTGVCHLTALEIKSPKWVSLD